MPKPATQLTPWTAVLPNSSTKQGLITQASNLVEQSKLRRISWQVFRDAAQHNTALKAFCQTSIELERALQKQLLAAKRFLTTSGTNKQLLDALDSHLEILRRESDTLSTALIPLEKLSISGERSQIIEQLRLLVASLVSFIEEFETSNRTSTPQSDYSP